LGNFDGRSRHICLWLHDCGAYSDYCFPPPDINILTYLLTYLLRLFLNVAKMHKKLLVPAIVRHLVPNFYSGCNSRRSSDQKYRSVQNATNRIEVKGICKQQKVTVKGSKDQGPHICIKQGPTFVNPAQSRFRMLYNSTTERPTKPKLGRMKAHHTSNS